MKLSPRDLIESHCRRRSYPTPEREHKFAAPVRGWAFDLAWPVLRIAIEIDGGVFVGGRHNTGTGYTADCEKLNEAVIRGWKVIRVTPAQVQSNQALGWVDRLLAGQAKRGK